MNSSKTTEAADRDLSEAQRIYSSHQVVRDTIKTAVDCATDRYFDPQITRKLRLTLIDANAEVRAAEAILRECRLHLDA